MARVALIAAVLVLFIVIQLASSQTACTDATNTLINQCNDDNVCRNPCRGYFDDYIDACGGISGQIITPNLVRSVHIAIASGIQLCS